MSLFNCDALCKVPRLVNVKSSCNGDVISEKLERNDSKACCEVRVDRGNVGHEVALILDFILSVRCKSHEVSASGFALNHVDFDLMERTNPVFNTAKMTLFQLTASGNEYAAAIAEKLGLNYENAQNSKSTKVSPEIAVLNNIILETRYLNRDDIT